MEEDRWFFSDGGALHKTLALSLAKRSDRLLGFGIQTHNELKDSLGLLRKMVRLLCLLPFGKRIG